MTASECWWEDLLVRISECSLLILETSQRRKNKIMVEEVSEILRKNEKSESLE